MREGSKWRREVGENSKEWEGRTKSEPVTLAVRAGLAYTARPSLSSSFALAVEVSPGRPREIL